MITTTEEHRLLTRVFTRPAFASLAKNGEAADIFSPLVSYGVLHEEKEPGNSLGGLFDTLWARLRSGYRNEYVYKNEIANRLVFGRHSPRTASFLVELPITRSIVDVAVFNGTSTAYEIKTEFDSTRRLQTQTKDYLEVFDRVYVVTHQDKSDPILKLLDPRVGVLTLTSKGTLRTIREAESNLPKISAPAVFNCLRREEYLSIIKSVHGATPAAPNGLIAELCEELFVKLPPEVFHQHFVKALKARTTDPITAEFVTRLPISLRALGYATPLTKSQRAKLLGLLAQPTHLSIS